ncbi:formin-like protein 3 isoform X2 [Lytechinus variegatus]|uniref:formin-like protein 3 isoform X2 n=1 Tax=Lytechinus variegatus TaxID=7654 RepID=UPI001BB20886|nr:formin-like protein 3 isoform X2 [Lytechinus variegatus]
MTQVGDTYQFRYIRPQPRPEIIERRFTRLKSNMQGGPDQILHMDGLSIEQKWRIINDEPSLKSSLHDVKYYKTQLEGHIDPTIHQEATMKKSSWKKMVKALAPVKEVIEDLKEDLHSAKTDFLKAFIADKVGGVLLLAKFLSQTQTLIERDRSQHNANNSASIQPPSRTSTLDKKQLKLLENIKRTTMEESDAMNCLRKISEDKEGLSIIIKGDDVLEIITSCIISRSLSARLYAFMVLIAVCESRDGLNRVLTALSAFRKKLNEKVRFHAITQMMFLEKSRVELVTICLRFINTMLSSTTDMNKRVYLQYELEMAEFNPIKLERLYRLEGELPPSIKLELDAWHSRYVSIQRLQENLTTIETRNALLRKEVDRQGSRMTDYEAENKALQTKILDLVARSDDYRDRVNELQDTIEKLTREYTKKTGQHAEKQFRNFDNLMKPLEPEQEGDEVTVIIEPQKTGERKLERKKSVIGEKKKEIVISKPAASKKAKAPPPPTPPPAPPDLPPSTVPGAPGVPLPPPLIGTVRKNRNRLMSKHALPMLNWNTITTPGNTIFKVLDDENVYDEMDFEDFENHFRLKETSATTATMEKLRRLQEKQAQKIRVVDNNRAKNLIITQRRIALSPKDIRGFVDRCDITGVPGEYAELLLNFVPTKDELKKLAENADNYEDMGEAEQFMFQMARVDRYESKLRLMTFMGIYSDLVVTLKPEIEAIVKACDSIVTSGKLKKLLEIVLAFGNYMNSSKRGPAIGFKLESLQRLTFVKSSDRSHNFLHYLVEAVNRCYPEIKDWYNDLQFDDLKSGSLEALTMDIQGLRKGLELAKFERERQMDNPIIGQFYVGAADTIHALSEGFKKMEEIYHYTTKMFGENGDHVEPINFFKLFKDFSSQYQAAERANSKNPIEVAPKRKPAKKKGSNNQQYGLPTQELPSAGITGRLGLFRRSTQNKGSYEVKSKATPSSATIPDESVTNLRRDSPSSSDSGIASMASSGDSGSARSIPYVSVDSSKTGGVVMTANGHGNAQTAGGEGGGGDKAADGNSNFWGIFSSLK